MLSFRAHRPAWADEIWLLVCDVDHADKITGYVSGPLTIQAREREGTILEPTLHLPRPAVQRLMDELWQLGIRPSSGEGNAGQLGATEKHLEDMRRLVFEPPRVEIREIREESGKDTIR